MTNEMLADAIKNNGEKGLITILWEKVRRLLYLKSDRIFFMMKERFAAVGVECSDLHQECYFVFLQALENYKPPFKFTTFLEFPFKSMIAKMLKKRKTDEAANDVYTISINEPLTEDGNSLAEIIPDPQNDIYTISDKKTDSEIIREEVEKLKENQKNVIKLYYFSELNDVKISEIIQIRPASVCQLRHRALSQLRRSGILKKLYYQPNVSYGKSVFLSPDRYYIKQK